MLLKWSKRMESVRKDVECTFGILKVRFRLLRMPIMLKDKNAISAIFEVCCMLHNRLLDHDNLNTIGDLESD